MIDSQVFQYIVETYDDGWRKMRESDRFGSSCFDTLEMALYSLKMRADLTYLVIQDCMIWPMRIIDTYGRVYANYDPEDDIRIPGCRWRITQRKAYKLWELAGCPTSDGLEFWYEAENKLIEHNGMSYSI